MALSPTEKISLLSEHFLLRHIPEGDLRKLVEFTTSQVFQPGDTIFKKGEQAGSMMVVASGNVRVSAAATEGDEIIFASMGPGDVFGEIALIDGYTRSADAVATEETIILSLESKDFLPVLQKDADLCINMLKVLCNRIRDTNAILEDFSFLDLRRRLAKRLIYLSSSASGPKNPMNISVRVRQDELIAMMGVSREPIDQQLAAWAEDGVIDLEAGWITVNDGERLSQMMKSEG